MNRSSAYAAMIYRSRYIDSHSIIFCSYHVAFHSIWPIIFFSICFPSCGHLLPRYKNHVILNVIKTLFLFFFSSSSFGLLLNLTYYFFQSPFFLSFFLLALLITEFAPNTSDFLDDVGHGPIKSLLGTRCKDRQIIT